MKQLIANLRDKPQHYRNRVVLITIVVVATIMLVIWAIVGMPPRGGGNGNVINDFNSNVNENKDTLPELFPKQ